MIDSDSLLDDCFLLSEYELSTLFKRAFALSRQHFSKEIGFYSPGMVHYDTEFHVATDPYRFPSISITGKGCALDCEHCHGRLLEDMMPATTPEDLWQICETVVKRGGSGCLISGGATPDGNTPLLPFIPTIERVKEELGIDIVVHTGIVFPEIAEKLGEAGIDGAMLDIIGSDDTIREVYHLDATTDVFDESMTHLEDNGVPFIPHVVAGLHFGQLLGELDALKMIAKHDPESIVVVALMPMDCTSMANITPASPMDITRVILAARLSRPDKPVILGCARPLGEDRRKGDMLAIDAGVNGIAYPTEEGYEYAVKRGLKPTFFDQCCSLIGSMFKS